MTPRIAVLIPCYNEQAAVPAVIRAFQAALPGASIHVYDNNSTDNTAAVAREAGAHVRTERLQGKGNVIRRMFADIEADAYVLVDGDDTYDAWPKHIGYTGLPLTEGLSLLLLTLCVLLFDLALAGSRRSLACAGLAYGAATLVRPSLVLMPAVWAGMAWVASGSRLRQMLSVAAAALIGLAVIAPWTARNLRVLGHPVLISTNGGDVLYRANNPLATGNWSPAGERDLDAFIRDEVRWNETGNAWAWEWIRSNPIGFAKLAIRKLGFLWGWEEEGIIFHMHYPEIAAAGRAFVITADIVMNGWWFALLCAVAASLMHQRAALTRSSLAIGFALSVLLLTAVHMLYESHARYHFPFVGALILLACTGPFLAAPIRVKRAKEVSDRTCQRALASSEAP